MKALIAILLLASAPLMADVNMPSLGSEDFAATARYAKKVAFDRADAFAADRGEEVVSLTNVEGRGLNSVYLATTDSGCEVAIAVGLFFRTKVTWTANCQ